MSKTAKLTTDASAGGTSSVFHFPVTSAVREAILDAYAYQPQVQQLAATEPPQPMIDQEGKPIMVANPEGPEAFALRIIGEEFRAFLKGKLRTLKRDALNREANRRAQQFAEDALSRL